jgi:hypothetical protein
MRRFGTDELLAASGLAQLANLSDYWKERTSRRVPEFQSRFDNPLHKLRI